MLKSRYMDLEKSPCEEFTYISEQTWQEFLRREDTPERQAKRMQGRLNARMQINHPHVGRIGYRGYRDIWEKEKQNEELKTEYHDIQDERAKNWVLARTRLNEQGRRILLPDVVDVAQQLIQCDQRVSQELDDSVVDPLINVLGPEQPGRTRAVGSTVGWKKGIEGFDERRKMSKTDNEDMKKIIDERLKEALEEERKQQRAYNLEMKMQFQEDFKNLKVEYMQTVASLQKNRVVSTKDVTNQHLMPQINPSPVPMQTQRPPNRPRLQDISEPLQVALFDPYGEDFLHDIARGMVYPTKNGILLHGSPILPCYMKVSIDKVYDKYMDLKLPVPVGEEIVTVGQATGSFIQWPVPHIRTIKKAVTIPNKTMTPPHETDIMKKNEEQSKKEEKKRKEEEEKIKEDEKRKQEEERKKKWEEEEMVRKQKMHLKIDLLRSSLVSRGSDLYYGYTTWMLRSDPTAPYTILIAPKDEIFGIKDQEVHIGVDVRDMIDLLTNDRLDVGIITWFECKHWVLYIIHKKQNTVYILDSLKRVGAKQEKIYKLTDCLIEVLGNGVKWIFPKCNKQNEGWECGYYTIKFIYDFVMKYMFEFLAKNPWKSMKAFTKQELNEVVNIWHKLCEID